MLSPPPLPFAQRRTAGNASALACSIIGHSYLPAREGDLTFGPFIAGSCHVHAAMRRIAATRSVPRGPGSMRHRPGRSEDACRRWSRQATWRWRPCERSLGPSVAGSPGGHEKKVVGPRPVDVLARWTMVHSSANSALRSTICQSENLYPRTHRHRSSGTATTCSTVPLCTAPPSLNSMSISSFMAAASSFP